MLLKKNAVYSVKNMNLISKLYRQNAGLCNAKAGGIYSSHHALRVNFRLSGM
jgi:hypothetical protein